MCRDGATMQNSAGEEITQVVSVADGVILFKPDAM